jgi:hypothetical protein
LRFSAKSPTKNIAKSSQAQQIYPRGGRKEKKERKFGVEMRETESTLHILS